MSSLDERLREIFQKNYLYVEALLSDDDAELIAQLKQAFENEGYINKSELKTWSYTAELYTGHEFYQRFWHEYDQPEGRNPILADSSIIREQVDQIVKRAAGITNEA